MTDSSRTLEQLEGENWAEPGYDSYLIKTIHRLRSKPIDEFTIEDLRITLGQKCGIEHPITIALNRLEADPFAQGDFYPGDLLGMVMGLPSDYWLKHPSEAASMERVAMRQTRSRRA